MRRCSSEAGRSEPVPALVGSLVGVAALVVLSGLIPLLCLQLPDRGRSAAWVLTAVLMMWAGARLAGCIQRGRPELFTLVWWLFVYLFLGLAPTVQIRSGKLPTTTPNVDPRWDWPAAIAIAVGVLAFELGTRFGRRDRPGASTATDVAPAVIDPRRAVLIVLVGVVVGLYYIDAIGVDLLFDNRSNVFLARRSLWPNAVVGSVVFAVAVYAGLVGAHALVRSRSGPRTPARTGLVVVGCLVALVCANPIGTARYHAGTVLLSVACLLGAFATVRRSRFSMIGILLGLLFVFPVFDAFRRRRVTFDRRGFLGEYAGNGDYDAFAQIANAVRYVDVVGIEWGRQFLGLVLFWVPRSVWPDKPLDTGILLAESRGYRFTNLSAPLWAESLVNFGWLGLIVVMFGLGVLVRRVDHRVCAALLGSGGVWAVVGGTIPFYGLILLRGSLLQAMGGLAVMALGVRLGLHRPGRRRPDRSTTAATRNGAYANR